MSRSAAAMNPGRTNRRFLIMAVVLGLVGAVLVYVAFSRSSDGGSGSGGPNVPVVVAKTQIPARTKITAGMLELKSVPEDARAEFAYTDTAPVIGEITRFPIAVNEQVTSTKIVPLDAGRAAASRALSYVVEENKRGFAISATEVQNVGGLVLPGDYVDILVVYDVEFSKGPAGSDREVREAFMVQTLLQNVEVLAVSQGVVDVVPEATPTSDGQRVRNSEGRAAPEAATVTLMLSPDDAQKLYLAELKGRLRFALRRFGDGALTNIDFLTEIDLFPKNLPNPFLR
jgi:pilus assembly protein CpaB